jgi:hypothetical protein
MLQFNHVDSGSARRLDLPPILRSEYGTVLKNNGGQLPPLTEALREKVERGAFAPQIN